MNRRPTRRQVIGGIFAGMFGVGLRHGQGSVPAAPAIKTGPTTTEIGGATIHVHSTESPFVQVFTYDAHGQFINREVINPLTEFTVREHA